MQEQTLFDDMPTQETNMNLANKIDSFYSKDVQQKRLSQKERVFLAIAEIGIANDREISNYTHIPRHLIPDRRLALKDRIIIAYSAKDPVTNKTVSYYELNEAV